jgi:hypothetical protein
VSGKAIAAAGLSAVAIATGGCSGDSEAEAESPPATTTEQVETQPPVQSAVDITKFRAAFDERFGTPGDEASWWGHITGMKIGQKMPYMILAIATDLAPTEGNVPENAPALMICRAAMGFALNSEAGDGIDGVSVRGSDGVGLVGCA